MMNQCLESKHPRENCGVFGVYGLETAETAASMIYRGLFSLQHRGQEGAGIAVSDGSKVTSAKGQGLVSEVFSKKSWELKGTKTSSQSKQKKC